MLCNEGATVFGMVALLGVNALACKVLVHIILWLAYVILNSGIW